MQELLETLSWQIELIKVLKKRQKRSVLLLTHRSCQFSFELFKDIDWTHIPFGTKRLNQDDIEKVHQQMNLQYDAIVSVGGGSVIDCAKIVKHQFFSTDSFHVAIPTTAGSGSEATQFAVIYDGLQKKSVSDIFLRPDLVILCPPLVQALPPSVKISSGFDAWAQAIESVCSLAATNESRHYAALAIARMRSHLEGFVREARLDQAKEIQLAAYDAGRAINISKTTLAHALSYYMTAKYGVPHGVAVFLTLPSVLAHYPISPYLLEICGMSKREDLINELEVKMEKFGIDRRLSSYGMKIDDLPYMVDVALNSGRMDNAPWKASKEELIALLRGLL